MHGNKEGEFRIRPRKFCVTHERRRGEQIVLGQEAELLDPRYDPIILGLYPFFITGYTGVSLEKAKQVAKTDLATFKKIGTSQQEREELIDDILTQTSRLLLPSDNPHAKGRLRVEAAAVLGSLHLAETPEEFALILSAGIHEIEGDPVAREVYHSSPLFPKNFRDAA